MTESMTPVAKVPERRRTDYVYSTSQYVRFGAITAAPDAVLHAKVVGTTSTLCGVPCGSWPKVFDLPFVKATGPRCLPCSLTATIPSRS